MKAVIRGGKVYALASERGKVSYLMRAGADMVRNVMTEGGALDMMTQGKLSQSDEFPGHPIAVNDQFFLPGTVEDENAPVPAPKKKRR